MGDSLRSTDTRTAPVQWQQHVRGEIMRGKSHRRILRDRGLPVTLVASLGKAIKGQKLRVETLFRLGAYKPRRYRDLSAMPVEILTLLIKHREEMY